MSHALALSPGGRLYVQPDEQAEPALAPEIAARLTDGFAASTARGLEMLASGLLHEPMPATFVFWRGLAQKFFTALCHNVRFDEPSSLTIPKPAESEFAALVEAAPPMNGLEYLSQAGTGTVLG